MSKAFTKEDEGAPEAPLRAERPKGPRRPMTPEGHRALRAELEALEASAPGGEIPLRAADVRALLDSVEPFEPLPTAATQIQFGSWVLLEDEEGARTKWRIVGTDEADARAHRLSIESPLAKALIGRRAGEELTFERPKGDAVEYRVVSVALSEGALAG